MIDWLSSPINHSVREEALGSRFSGHASLLSFQEQTVYIQQEIGKTVARVLKNARRTFKPKESMSALLIRS